MFMYDDFASSNDELGLHFARLVLFAVIDGGRIVATSPLNLDLEPGETVNEYDEGYACCTGQKPPCPAFGCATLAIGL
jgi:hypothetical protein